MNRAKRLILALVKEDFDIEEEIEEIIDLLSTKSGDKNL